MEFYEYIFNNIQVGIINERTGEKSLSHRFVVVATVRFKRIIANFARQAGGRKTNKQIVRLCEKEKKKVY